MKIDKQYADWIRELKNKIRSVQLKAAVQVNVAMLNFYWEMGADIVKKQETSLWGEKLIDRLSHDLMDEFPDMKGFSRRNLMYIQKWYLFYSRDVKLVQQAVALITQIPWGHNLAIINKSRSSKEAIFYVQKTIENGWSRAVLTHHIEKGLFKVQGKALTNFKATLQSPQSDLARQTLKDPYNFDFLTLREKHDERDLEDALMTHMTKFLIELGSGFSFIGRQYRINIGGEEYTIDLLFYHVRLHCYVVVELKAVKFKPEFAGKLNFYVSAVDGILKTAKDNPTVGMLICKSKNKTVVEYALKDINKPIGVSEYRITQNLPKELALSLPSIEAIEAELDEGDS